MKRLLIIFLTFLPYATLLAQTQNTWTGNVSNQWSDASNWSLGIVPGNCHEAVIPTLSNKPYPVLSTNVSIGKISFSGGTLSMNNFNIALVLDQTCSSSSCSCTDCGVVDVKDNSNPSTTESAVGDGAYNYTIENTHLAADGSSVSQSITYLDGLGRPVQKVAREAGGTSISNLAQITDLVQPIEYDAYGREAKKYLSFAASTSGNFAANASAQQSSYYAGIGKTGNAYTNIVYENSPSGRILSQTAAGSSNAVTFVYRSNTTADAVKILSYNFSTNTIDVSSYAAAKLYVTETTDENNNKTVEFKDSQDRLICKEVSGLRTSYCYDDFNQLRCVIPPKASALLSSTNFNPLTNDLLFVYGYDERGRMSFKKIPGAGTTNMTYDDRDRLLTSTDAKSQVVTNVYDDLNRITSVKLAGNDVIKNYYDSYPAVNDALENFDQSHAFGITKLSNTKGMLTASEKLDLQANTMLRVTTYYDALGRTIQSAAKNHKGSYDKSSSKLDFTGRSIETKLSTRNNLVVQTRSSFDRGGRQKAVCQMVSDGTTGTVGAYWEPVGRYSYNGIGEMTSKTLGCNLQKVDYAYNMRGWMTNMNNPSQLVSGEEKDLFGMNLGYDAVGNIINWNYRAAQKTGLYGDANSITPKDPFSYNFGYDNLNRLKTATLTRMTGGTTSTVFELGGSDNGKMGYDENGNIASLKRTFNGGVVDNLTYIYPANTNRLGSISDAGTNPTTPNEFVTGNSSYTYDANGNLISDSGKGITNIVYNYLNLPQTITKSGQSIAYNYAADGQKLKANFGTNKVYDYISGLGYVNDSLEFIPTAEGRILPPTRAVNPQLNGNTAAPAGIVNPFYRYEYDLKDHLGNSRVACRCGEKSGAATPGDTYPLISVQENHFDPWGLSLPLNADSEKVGGSPVDRYTYNGKEKQLNLGWFDYGARMYDPQLGRWNGVDFKTEKYLNSSPYTYVFNRPLIAVDPDGMDVIFIVRGNAGAKDRSLTYKNGNAKWNDTNKQYNGTGANNTIFRVLKAYQKIEKSGDEVLIKQLHGLVASTNKHYVEENVSGVINSVRGDGNRDPNSLKEGSQLAVNFSAKSRKALEEISGVPESDFSTIVHELRHQYDHEIGNTKDNEKENSATDPSEIRAVNNENRARKIEGLPQRTKYGREIIDPKKLQNPPNNL